MHTMDDKVDLAPVRAFVAQLGLSITRRLGWGSEGVVYGLADGRVMKVTSSREEAAIAAFAIRMDNAVPGLPRFDDVRYFTGYDIERYAVIREDVPGITLDKATAREYQVAMLSACDLIDVCGQTNCVGVDGSRRRDTWTTRLNLVVPELAGEVEAPARVAALVESVIETARQLKADGIQVGDVDWVANLGQRADGQVCLRDLGTASLEPRHYAALDEHLAHQHALEAQQAPAPAPALSP